MVGPNLLSEYQSSATHHAQYPGKGTPFGVMYLALGLAEAGEVQGKAKKAFRDDDLLQIGGSYSDATFAVKFGELNVFRRAQLIKELGGLLWYMAALCNELNTTLSEVALANLQQLAERTERDTLRGDGDDR